MGRPREYHKECQFHGPFVVKGPAGKCPECREVGMKKYTELTERAFAPTMKDVEPTVFDGSEVKLVESAVPELMEAVYVPKSVEAGKRIYERYCMFADGKSLMSGADLPAWESLPFEVKCAWVFTAWGV